MRELNLLKLPPRGSRQYSLFLRQKISTPPQAGFLFFVTGCKACLMQTETFQDARHQFLNLKPSRPGNGACTFFNKSYICAESRTYDNARVKDWSWLPCSAESLTPVCRGHALTFYAGSKFYTTIKCQTDRLIQIQTSKNLESKNSSSASAKALIKVQS